MEVIDIKCTIGETTILNSIRFSVSKGETIGIIGPNGSGKTTLFNCISGFAPITSGKVLFKGEEIQNLEPASRAERGVGRIFQSNGIFREMSVVENVVIAIEGRQSIFRTFLPWGKATRLNRERAWEYLKEVSLEKKGNAKAGSLSGGQMRLLEIIRTKAFGAELFLLDEPTAGVSPKMKDEVVSLIQGLQREGKTIIVIEHDMQFIQQFCSRIVVLDTGRVVLDDVPEKVRENQLLQEVYFGKGQREHPAASAR